MQIGRLAVARIAEAEVVLAGAVFALSVTCAFGVEGTHTDAAAVACGAVGAFRLSGAVHPRGVLGVEPVVRHRIRTRGWATNRPAVGTRVVEAQMINAGITTRIVVDARFAAH